MDPDTTTLANPVNNAVYDLLGERWYTAQDDPIALLRAETAHRTPWMVDEIRTRFGEAGVLDIGCGAGFLANALAAHGFDVTGLDASSASLEVAARHDVTRSVHYDVGDAYELPYPNGSFEVVCAMDFLEHVVSPERVIAEASRVLAPNGLFFFHTFNRTLLSWIVVIKGVEWFVRNTPEDLHVHALFRTPAEIRGMCAESGLSLREVRGQMPDVMSWAFFRMLATGVVPHDFAFRYTSSTTTGYMGVADKR
ncbi:MAG: gamma-tocopherol methyltransferase [Myxococcaceae bacterium]|nr:gamma-tocopherol methyltransferase [Myxococcaceae bacterium]